MHVDPCPWCLCPMMVYSNPDMGDPIFTIGVDKTKRQTHADFCKIQTEKLYQPFHLCNEGIIANTPERAIQLWGAYIENYLKHYRFIPDGESKDLKKLSHKPSKPDLS